MDCVFCRIVAGTEPSAKLYEDDDALVFLNWRPFYEGHALAIPKRHWETVTGMPAGAIAPVLEACRKVAPAILAATGAHGFNLVQANGTAAGQSEPHLHFHVVPRKHQDDFANVPLGDLSRARRQVPHAELEAVAARIRAAQKIGPAPIF